MRAPPPRSYCDWNFWRFEFAIPTGTVEKKVSYQVDGAAGGDRVGGVWARRALAPVSSPRLFPAADLGDTVHRQQPPGGAGPALFSEGWVS